MAPSVYIIILNYNGGSLTRRCVESFQTVTYPNHHVILVDNGSTDGSENESAAACRNLILLRSNQNLGYTGGNNLGLRFALEKGADYVLVVNNDTEVINPNFMTELVAFAESHPQIGAVGPKVYIGSRGQIQNTLCNLPSFLRSLVLWPAQKLGWRRVASGNVPRRAEVLNGVCLLIKAALLRSVGLFDESIFMYRDDTDLALRSRNSGWEWHYCPVESIVHHQRTLGYDYVSMVNFLLKRNAVYTFRKHGDWANASAFALASVLLSYSRALVASIRLNRVRAHWRFALVLLKACKAALAGSTSSPDFGPPVRGWKELDVR